MASPSKPADRFGRARLHDARRSSTILGAALAGVLVPAPLRGGTALVLAALIAGLLTFAAAMARRTRKTAQGKTDPLTGLPDAASFRSFVTDEVDLAGRPTGVLFLELRQTGLLGSTFGREALEWVYALFGSRLRHAVRRGDGVAHFGGGLFTVALRNINDRDSFNQVADRLRRELARPLLLAGTSVHPRWNAAGVLAPEDGSTAGDLLAAAETARELATAEPGQPLPSLPAEARDAAEQCRRRRRELLDAEADGSFFPLFQPQLDVVTGAVDRAEVLMRWQRSDGSVAAPGVFLDELRQLDALPRVSARVYGSAFAEAAVWRDAGFSLSRLAVNLDASQVAMADWARHLLATLAESPLPATAIEVEVSEDILAHVDVERLVAGLVLLREAGISVSLDDFGTGYASLTQIADLPIDLVKIDARLLWDASRRARTQLVVDGIVALMRKLALPCIFEGVETPEQLALARRLGARWAQGFLIGRPMSGPELETRLVQPASLRRAPATPRLAVG